MATLLLPVYRYSIPDLYTRKLKSAGIDMENVLFHIQPSKTKFYKTQFPMLALLSFRDCVKGVGYEILKKAYEILDRIEEEEVEVHSRCVILNFNVSNESIENLRILKCMNIHYFVSFTY